MKLRGPERAVLVIFGGAFVLSLFIGLVSKKPFGIALGRAFIASILFGAIFAGGLLLLKRYIPDLGSIINQNRQREEPEAQDAEAGRVVDYIVGEGVADGAPGVFQNTGAYAGSGSPIPEQGEIGADIGELDRLSPVFDLGGQSEPTARGDRAQGSGTVTLTPAARAKGVVETGPGPRVRSAGQEEGDGIEEALPSLDALFESEEEATGSAEARSSEVMHDEGKRTGAQGDYISIGDARIPNEPGVMAKAIKRIMKQD
jgi:hypothetical protein